MTNPPNGDLETPAEDAAEQAASAVPGQIEDGQIEDGQIEDGQDDDRTLDDETPEWDAQEQSRVVELDDEYR